MLRNSFVVLALLFMLLFIPANSAEAQLTPAHRKDLATLTKQVNLIPGLIRKKDFAQAESELTEAAEKLKAITTESGVAETDAAIKRVSTLIDRQRTALAKAAGKDPAAMPDAGGAVSFVKDIAPIITEKCVRCHGENNPRKNLRLDTFAGWRAGGQGGILLTPGNPRTSLLIARLNAPQGQGRMPAQGDPLSDEQKEKIANWIKAGAPFDGTDPTMSLSTLIVEEAKKTVKLPKPKGTETVSFTRDIAPWMATLCLNCHNANRKTSGLSMETFFDIMKGGDSGEVIIPGDHEGSRLFRLTGGLELPRMPANQARLTRKNYDDLKKWFEEGNTYDGNDPMTPIRNFVPSEAELARRKFGNKTDAEMRELRQSRTNEQYKDATGTAPSNRVDTGDFLVVGDVDQARLQAVSTLAKSQLEMIQKEFGGTGAPWRGGLTIYVWKTRDGYEQFASQAEQKRASRDVFGHAVVTMGHEDAYLVLQDTGDAPQQGPGLKETLAQQLTVAYLQRGEKQIPNWMALGFGYVMSEPQAGADRVKAWKEEAAVLAPAVNQPDELFVDGTFSPSSTGAISHTLLKFIEAQGGKERFVLFRRAVEGGETVNNAIKSTYGTEGSAVAAEFFKNLRSR